MPISGGRVPRDLALPSDWLAPHGEKFTLEGTPRLIFFLLLLLSFQLNVECGALKGHSECVKICACVCLFAPAPPILHRDL